MRILGIDLGEKRVGLALSDPLGITAQGLETLLVKNKKDVVAGIAAVCKKHEVIEIVIGLPVNMNGSFGPKAQEVQTLIPVLEKITGVPVCSWDERLTSRQAGRLMIDEGLSRQKQRKNSDRMAATLILQNFLESKRRG
jgi:putative Holliday junction resolvase